MTLQRKLALFVLVAALAPVVLIGFVMVRGTEAALGRAGAAEQLARAEAAATGIDVDVAGGGAALDALLASWRFETLSEVELRGALFLLVKQLPQVDAAAVLDGKGVPRAVVTTAETRDAQDLVAGVQELEPPGDRLAYVVYGGGGDAARLAAVRRVAERGGWRLAVRLRPELFRRRLDPAVPAGGAAWVSSASTLIVGSTGAAPLDASTLEELRSRVDPSRSGTLVGGSQVVAWAPLEGLPGWVVLVSVPVEIAYGHVAEMRRTLLLAVLGVAAGVLALSFLVARRTTAGLARIDSAARALGGGELSVRLPVQGSDEIAAVSRTFNGMAEELALSRTRLERWNEELQAEVEARTKELRAAQAQVVEAQKLAAIGQLGAGVAHEINNPLTGILGNAQLLLESVKPGDRHREALEKIEALARRCREITLNLLRFSEQRAEPDVQDVDLNRIVVDALGLVDGQIREGGIALELDLASPSPRTRGDAGHLAQVVLNLVQNARTACLERPGAEIRVGTREGREGVELVVKDNGKGIAPENLPRIFEPFFTTKDLWSSVGLGLSVTYRIVSEHGGRIGVESRPGEGSTFTVVLPSRPR